MGSCGSKPTETESETSGIRTTRKKNKKRDTHKVVLVGDKAVGKSSLVLRYTKDQFQEAHALTIGAAFVSKDLIIRNSATGIESPIRLHLWDTAGEEAYRSMTRFFYREAEIGIVVYDITQRESFENCFVHEKSWINEFRAQCPEAEIIIAGNKQDCEGNRQVNEGEGNQKADENNLYHLEVSAKTNFNVQELFKRVAILLYKKTNPEAKDEDLEVVGNTIGKSISNQ